MSLEKWIEEQKEKGVLDGEMIGVDFELLYLLAKIGFQITPAFVKSLETPEGREEVLMKVREMKKVSEDLLDRIESIEKSRE